MWDSVMGRTSEPLPQGHWVIDIKFDLPAHLEHVNTMFHPAWKQAKLQPRDHLLPLMDTFIGLLGCCNKTKMKNVMCRIMFIDFFPELKAKF